MDEDHSETYHLTDHLVHQAKLLSDGRRNSLVLQPELSRPCSEILQILLRSVALVTHISSALIALGKSTRLVGLLQGAR